MLPTLLTMTYNHSKVTASPEDLYNTVGHTNLTSTLLTVVVFLCIIYVFYAFAYVSFWYIDRHMNRTKFRLFTFLTLGKARAEDVGISSVMMYSVLVVFIVILTLTGVLNTLVMYIFNLILGG